MGVGWGRGYVVGWAACHVAVKGRKSIRIIDVPAPFCCRTVVVCSRDVKDAYVCMLLFV